MIKHDKVVEIRKLGLSQIYLSAAKREGVRSWFCKSLVNFEPVPVRDFLGDGSLTLTDGHTRVFVAWENGLDRVPIVFDEDEIVTCELGHELYTNDIVWCRRFGLDHIGKLAERIVSASNYKTLWITRCERLERLVLALQNFEISRSMFTERKRRYETCGLFVVGLSEDKRIVYCENQESEMVEIRFDEFFRV